MMTDIDAKYRDFYARRNPESPPLVDHAAIVNGNLAVIKLRFYSSHTSLTLLLSLVVTRLCNIVCNANA